jgi:Cytochrome c554 and c-prime
MAGVFAVGFAVFVTGRSFLIPPDFGKFGFYRAGALDDVMARPMKYAGEETCVVCHSAVDEARQNSRHQRIHCEACHGPLLSHVNSDFTTKPAEPNPRLLCLTCHTKMAGKPDTFPQIVPTGHFGDGACTDCHQPHHPKIKKE